LKENDEEDENMYMAAAGFIFLASKVLKKLTKGFVLGEVSIE
jgi:hypothetical protein